MSSLSSLLVRDGVVSVKRMERAFQAQVIDGGGLDTILLEQELIDEERLLEYLSAASGLPAASWDDCEVLDDEALRRCPLELASEHDVAPLAFEGGALTVLVRDPFDPARLGALAERLGVSVVPMIAPEYRWHLVFTRDYDQPPDDRFVNLATAVGVPATGEVRHRGLQERGEPMASTAAPEPAPGHGEPEAEPAPPPEIEPDLPPPAPPEEQPAPEPAHEPEAEPEPPPEPQAEPDAPEPDLPEPATPEPQRASVTAGWDIPDEYADSRSPEVSRPAMRLAAVAHPDPGSPSAQLAAQAEAAQLAAQAEAAELDDEPVEVRAPVIPRDEPIEVRAPVIPRDEPIEVRAPVVPYDPPGQPAEPAPGRAVHAPTQPLPAWRGEDVPAVAAATAATVGTASSAVEPSRAERRSDTLPGLAVSAVHTAAAPAPAPAPTPRATPAPMPAVTPPSGPSDGVPARALSHTDSSVRGLAARVALLEEDERPLVRAAAAQLIAIADDRDAVFHALLRALRDRTRWAGILVVQGGHVVGKLALADVGIDTAAVTNVSIPLDRPSPWHAVTVGRHPYLGQVTSGDPAIDDNVVRMGGAVPSAALLLPIVLRDRCVALAVAHRGALPLTMADVSDLLPLATAAAEALGRILLSRKREQAPSPPPPAADPLAPRSPRARTLVPEVSRGGFVGGGVVTQVRSRREAVSATAPVIVAPALRPVSELFAELASDDADIVAAAVAEGTLRADELLPLLPARFPGPLKVDRYATAGRTLPPAQYGPLLELMVRIGARATDPLVELLADADRDVRFYAAVCLGGLRPHAALPSLAERIFDADYGVRNVALEVLATFSPRDIDQVMTSIRPALHSDDLERVAAVAHAATVLTDVGALGDLVEVVGRDSRRAELARRALVALTRHDMGTSARRWRTWYDEHRSRHRIEWLIDALGNRDQPLREAALEDLRRLTGEDFGGVADDGRREREALTERWRAWWSKTGRRRFVA